MVKTRNQRKSHNKSYNKTRKNIGSSIIVGVIHAKWCGHCQMLMPKWNKFKRELRRNKKVTILEIEDSEPKKEKRIADLNVKINDKAVRIQANGFPTIFKISHGHLEYYNGNREPAALKQWALGQHKQPLPTPLPAPLHAPLPAHKAAPEKKPMGLFGLF
jgi:thiol-disulfide isomerase/thioredoxin